MFGSGLTEWPISLAVLAWPGGASVGGVSVGGASVNSKW